MKSGGDTRVGRHITYLITQSGGFRFGRLFGLSMGGHDANDTSVQAYRLLLGMNRRKSRCIDLPDLW